jgi:hypothetical protein
MTGKTVLGGGLIMTMTRDKEVTRADKFEYV